MRWSTSKRQAMINALLEDKSKKVALKKRGGDLETNKIESEVIAKLKRFRKKVVYQI